jgi:anti-sigma regulatory factor (Ser/Thr protein kinase)
MTNFELNFQPKARLLLQLGDQLIRNESIALLELIKNAYDAYASKVRISMKNIEQPEIGEIIIEDDGWGMNSDIIKNVWMQPGSDYKYKIVQSLKNAEPGFRIPIGEKGIGRFGAHKLGYIINLTSKATDSKEVCLEIDWREFEKDDLLNNIKVNLIERDIPKHFTDSKTGTCIKISALKQIWQRGTVRDLYRAVTSLSSPFDDVDSFKVYFSLDKQEWLTNLFSFEDVKDSALYYAEAIIENNKIIKLNYEFRPWDTMDKLNERKECYNDIRMVKEIDDEITGGNKTVDIDLSSFKIGRVSFKILIFDRTPKILSLGVSDKKGLKEYLDNNGGIRVFRDGIRVYDYGEPDNDWLNLDIRRVNRPGITISNNIIIGAVYLDRKTSMALVENTNREGFVENEAYMEFWRAVNFTLGKIITQRNIDKDKVREFYGSVSVSEPVIGNLRTLQAKIEEKISDGEYRKELLGIIKSIEKDYEFITEIYTRTSSAGLSLGIVIHEVEKIINELVVAVDKLPTDAHIKSLVSILHKTISDYAAIIKRSPKVKEDLIEIVDQSLSNIQYRIKAHNIDVIRRYQDHKNINTTVRCNANLIISTIINLIDNTIYWQNYAYTEAKKVFIDIIEEPAEYISILIADNGPGFSIPPEEAVKPFISNRDGMGLGLHLANEIMKAHKGRLLFPEPDDYLIPDEFKKGAIILLAFNK